MNVGILTHPQAINYGGILQCYALSVCLEKMGHKAIVIRRGANTPCWRLIATKVIDSLGMRRFIHSRVIDKSTNINFFSEKYLYRTYPLLSQKAMRRVCEQYQLDAVIVGSDQVWRADFALSFGYNYFLDFVPANVKKISFAASFGLSTWDYTPEQTRRIKDLLADYRGISVREEEAISLCKDYLGLDVMQMPDPTLLLSAADYVKVTSPRLVKGKYVFVYWLGDKTLVEADAEIYRNQGYEVVFVGLREQIVLPKVEDWLSYLMYADKVLTDSFHGCVFSIIFKKELHVFSNVSGGNGRVVSLFKQFGFDGTSVYEKDYGNSSSIFKSLQERAIEFLNHSLR